MNLIDLAERGVLPDAVIRMGIRRLLAKRSRAIAAQTAQAKAEHLCRFCESLKAGPLAVSTTDANKQHYEVPADFFQAVLGPRLKYSACLFESAAASLADAEEAMLRLTCQRADMQDCLRVLELGCGWGSLTLWLAEHYPNCTITAVSNSASQRRYIEARLADRGLTNVRVLTADMRDFATDERFDRILSVEMFEHMHNYKLLLERLANWLSPQGIAFVHIFCHQDSPYLFQTEGRDDWMGRNFFTGGMMPSERLFDSFDQDLSVTQQWRVSGLHYWRTCEAWLRNLDAHKVPLLALFGRNLPPPAAKQALQRWRMFFMACAELFRYADGEEWFVAHYRLRHQTVRSPTNPPPLASSH